MEEVYTHGMLPLQGITMKALLLAFALLPQIAQPTYSISGRFVPAEAARGALLTLNVRGVIVQATVAPDGSFTFSGVPAQTHSINLQRGNGPRMLIGNVPVSSDVKGLVVLNGRVDVDDSSPAPSNANASTLVAFAMQAWVPVPPSPAGLTTRVISNAVVQPDGSMDLLLPEGDYNISLRNVPFGYDIRALTSGNTDLLTTRLNVSAGANMAAVRASLVKTTPRGVSVSGRLRGLQGGVVTLTSGLPKSVITSMAVNPDGTFEFPVVPPGAYSLRAEFDIPGPQTAVITPGSWWIQVGEQNIRSIEFFGTVVQGFLDGGLGAGMLPPESSALRINGRVSVVDDAGVSQSVPGGIMIRFSNHLTAVRPDGSFTVPVGNGDHMLGLNGVSAGYGIRSMTRGSTNLLTTPLRIDNATTGAEEVRIVLELNRRDAGEGRSRVSSGTISGRLLNADRSPAANVPVHAALSVIGAAVVTSITDGAGNYRLENLPPNTYVVSVGPLGVGFTQSSFVVSSGATSAARIAVGYGMDINIGAAVVTTTNNRGGTRYDLQR